MKYGISYSDELTEKLLKCIDYIKRMYPYSVLNSKEEMLLQNLHKSIDENSKEASFGYLKQLSIEVANKETQITRKEKANRIAIFISIVGTVLTIVFGILSFIKK